MHYLWWYSFHPSCFPLEKKHIIIALYFIPFAVSLIRANLTKEKHRCGSWFREFKAKFPWCLFSFSSMTRGFSGQVNTNSSYPKYLHNTEGTQTHNLPFWRAMWPFRSRKNSEQRVSMPVVTPPPVQRGALRPSQDTASQPSIFKLLLHFVPYLLLPPPTRLSYISS